MKIELSSIVTDHRIITPAGRHGDASQVRVAQGSSNCEVVHV